MKRLCILVLAVGLLGYAVAFAAPTRNPTRAVLDRVLPEMKFANVPLTDCMDFLRDVSGANIHVNWKALEEKTITKDTTVNMRLRSVTLRKVLNVLLSEAGGSEPLTFYIDEGVIEITTRELADKQLFTKVYPVDDLLMDIPDFANAPSFNLSSSTSGTSTSGGTSTGMSSSSTGLFSNTTSSGSTGTNAGTTKLDRAQQLIDLIVSTIQSDIWKENGGLASIRYWNGSLIVTAPRSAHEAIGGPID